MKEEALYFFTLKSSLLALRFLAKSTTQYRALVYIWSYLHVVARSARQWMKERGIIDMHVRCWVYKFSDSFGSPVDEITKEQTSQTNRLFGG